jgi:Taurine catabolism dioxygenase TauD, TfdA family
MLRLDNSMTAAVEEVCVGPVDEPPVSEAALGKVREAALRCEPLSRIAALTRAVLDEQGFVQVRGLPLGPAQPLFLAFATLLGEPFIDPGIGSALVPAHVRPGEALMGNQLRRLPLHTDYSMMEQPPRLTLSYCVQPDVMPGFGALYVSDIEGVCFGIEADPMIKDLMTVLLPFASRSARDDVDVIERPILSHEAAQDRVVVRYHRSRIQQGFRYQGKRPTPEQCSAMLNFERLADSGVQVLHPEAGDITIIDNHRAVHGRERCSVVVSANGTITGRQMMFLFAY